VYDHELERFKSVISLVHFAIERYGYRRDRRESSRASHVLRNPSTNDKIVVRKAPDGHWTYFSVRDDRDSGTIVDFVQARGAHDSLGHVRRELRDWLGMARPEPEPWFVQPPAPARDARALAAAFAAAQGADSSLYLNRRGIRPETLRAARFAGTWRLDARGNTLFVHTTDAGEVTGFEIKGPSFTRFSPGGTKSAWQSAKLPSDCELVLTESAIDALSHFQLHPARAVSARYLSTGGTPGARQVELLERVFERLSGNFRVVAAVDADGAGEKLAGRFESLVRGYSHLTFQRDSPSPAKDWNDVLQEKERAYIRALPRGR
jgi:hypothetical protein